MRSEIRIACPAKINLVLDVIRKREDGFHELESLMVGIGLYDSLTLKTKSVGIRIECAEEGIPTDASNLAYRAADLFFKQIDKPANLTISLEKGIPAAAGLGGGSSNAAGTLKGLNELYGFPLSHSELTALAAQLGSDVPFFIHTLPAIAHGRGEKLSEVSTLRGLDSFQCLVINPGFGVSTPWAYQSLNLQPGESTQTSTSRCQNLAMFLAAEKPSPDGFASLLYNSLEPAVISKYPWIEVAKERLRGMGAAATLMSGSGSTVFGVFPKDQDTIKLQKEVNSLFGETCFSRVVPFLTKDSNPT